MATCRLYKGPQLLGTGSITNGATSVTGWTAAGGTVPIRGRYIGVAITSSTHVGSVYWTRVAADNGAGTLTLRHASPFAT